MVRANKIGQPSAASVTHRSSRADQRDPAAAAPKSRERLLPQALANPSQLSPADLLVIQRTAGNRAVSQLLSKPRHQPRPEAPELLESGPRQAVQQTMRPPQISRTGSPPSVQRKKYSSGEVIDALQDIEFGGTAFEEKVKLHSQLKTDQGRTLRHEARRRLESLATKADDFSDREYTALQISYVTDTVAEYMARSEKVDLPRMKDQISGLLVKHFGDTIRQDLGTERPKGSVTLAGKLAGDDPVELYVKRMISLEAAAGKIRDIAGKEKPGKMLKLYIQRFQDRIKSLHGHQVQIGEEKPKVKGEHENFRTGELIGNITTSFYDYVKGTTQEYVITETNKWSDGIQNRYSELRTALSPSEEQTGTGNQGEPPHITKFKGLLPTDKRDNAATVWQSMVDALANQPILIIFKFEEMKKTAQEKTSTKYQSMLGYMVKEKSVSELIKPNVQDVGKVKTLMPFTEAMNIPDISKTLGERKESYGRWREEKDTRAAGHELGRGDYPVFGFVPYYDYSQVGANVNSYYGDTIFVLKSGKKQGAHYKWTDQGKPRDTPEGALKDMLDQAPNQVIAAATYLAYGQTTISPGTEMEAIIPGKVKIPRDVERIIAAKNPREVDTQLFGKELTRTADQLPARDLETVDYYADEARKHKKVVPEKRIRELAYSTSLLKQQVHAQLQSYDANTSAKGFLGFANPDKQRVTTALQAVQPGTPFANWKGPLYTFTQKASPPRRSAASNNLVQIKATFNELNQLDKERSGLEAELLKIISPDQD